MPRSGFAKVRLSAARRADDLGHFPQDASLCVAVRGEAWTLDTHTLYAYRLRRWFGWCETNGLDPLVGIQSAHVELYIRHLGESGSLTSTASSPATRPCTRGSPRSTATSPAPRA